MTVSFELLPMRAYTVTKVATYYVKYVRDGRVRFFRHHRPVSLGRSPRSPRSRRWSNQPPPFPRRNPLPGTRRRRPGGASRPGGSRGRRRGRRRAAACAPRRARWERWRRRLRRRRRRPRPAARRERQLPVVPPPSGSISGTTVAFPIDASRMSRDAASRFSSRETTSAARSPLPSRATGSAFPRATARTVRWPCTS